MTINPEILTLIETFGPMVLSIIGAVLTVTFGALAGLARVAWKVHQRRMLAMADGLGEVAKALRVSDEHSAKELQNLWNSIQGLRAELQMANKNTENIKTGLLKVEGALENHRATLYQHIEKLGRIDSKLEAVFKFIDAPRRATNIGG